MGQALPQRGLLPVMPLRRVADFVLMAKSRFQVEVNSV